MTSRLKLAVCGAAGRMGARVLALAETDPRFSVELRVDRSATAKFASEISRCAVAVDFSAPDATVAFADACALSCIPFVTGTTGLSDVQRAKLAQAARKTAIFSAPNFSRGAAVLTLLTAEAARWLEGFDAAIVETHHKGKLDKPSGTALKLAQTIRETRGEKSALDVHSLRMGDVVGEHEVRFVGTGESIALSHRALSRDSFARGALDAAAWVARQKPGLYAMDDMLEIA